MADERFYQKSGPYTLQDIAVICRAEFAPDVDGNQVITDVSPLHKADSGQISCFHNPKYLEQFKNTKASACLVAPEYAKYAPKDLVVLLTPTPYRGLRTSRSPFLSPYQKNGRDFFTSLHSLNRKNRQKLLHRPFCCY